MGRGGRGIFAVCCSAVVCVAGQDRFGMGFGRREGRVEGVERRSNYLIVLVARAARRGDI